LIQAATEFGGVSRVGMTMLTWGWFAVSQFIVTDSSMTRPWIRPSDSVFQLIYSQLSAYPVDQHAFGGRVSDAKDAQNYAWCTQTGKDVHS
jgi:hypothetical protein